MNPTGWAEVATHRGLELLRLGLDARLARVERRIIQWNVATVLTGLGALTAIVRLG